MCAWRGDGRRARSRSRPRAHPHSGVQYVSGYPPSSNYTGSGESSSDYSSSDDYRSVHVSAGRGRMRLPRAPAAPGSPNGPPSLDSSLDSPSSMASSGMYHDYSTISPHLVEPKIVDPHCYTGAYGYGGHHDRFVPPARPPSAMKRKPASVSVDVPLPPAPNISHEPNCIIAEPDSPSSPATSRRGGPKARSYLSADAGPPPLDMEVQSPPLSPAGPTQAEAHYHSTMVYPSYYPQQHGVPQQQIMHRHPHHPGVEAPEAQWYDDDEDYDESVYRRPRNQVRHIPVEMRPRSRSRARSRGAPSSRGGGSITDSRIEVVEYERRHRHRHRSRSRHHRHRSRGPGEEKRSADLQAQIDALTTRLSNIMDDPYAKDIIASEGIKFDVLYSAGK